MKKIFLFLVLCLYTYFGYAQLPDLDIYCRKCEEISINDFKDKIVKYLSLKDTTSLSANDYILMVRLKNTITFNEMDDEIYKDYVKLFYKRYLSIIIEELKCELTKGMCYYSPKYELFIGCKPDSKSMLKVVK